MMQKEDYQSDMHAEPSEVTPRLEEVEAAKMTRRAALAKLGIRAGAAVFAAMNVDTIARMVGAEMQRQGKSNKVANKLANEFRNAGIAFAEGGGGSNPSIISSSAIVHCAPNYCPRNYCTCQQCYSGAGDCETCCTARGVNVNACITLCGQQ